MLVEHRHVDRVSLKRESELGKEYGFSGYLRGDSYIVHSALVEDYFQSFKHLDADLARWTFPRKQLDIIFPALILFPERKWYAFLKSSPQPGLTKQPEPVAINLTTWEAF